MNIDYEIAFDLHAWFVRNKWFGGMILRKSYKKLFYFITIYIILNLNKNKCGEF